MHNTAMLVPENKLAQAGNNATRKSLNSVLVTESLQRALGVGEGAGCLFIPAPG